MREPGVITVPNETEACSSRITREGRRITYKARIIQQPDRARACGSGAKSCADRRPVDPPPIIELRIFEGPAENEKDITYEYEANFFVFATLEHARHMASGRAAGPAPNNVPVLTGSPVAGMALLERPTPAGYFIFPDLSVRHEGKYRLNFSLYEELKSPKDMDSETPDNAALQKQPHVSHRLEVKTIPFTVYSAKKFPGLTCSTHLSQMFAEQGCRVRIRRDVRMRRRETAKGQAYDDEEDQPQAGYQYENRPRASATPDAYAAPNVTTPHPPTQPDAIDRQRSSSIVSSHGHVRRSSSEHMHQQYQQAPYASSPQTPQGVYQPQQQWNQPPPPPSQQYMPAQSYTQPQYPPAPPPPMAPPTYGYVPPQYQQEPQHSRHNSLEYPLPSPHQAPPRSAGTPQPHPQQHLPAYQGYGAPQYPPPNGSYPQPPPQAAAMPPISPNIAMAPHPQTPTYMSHAKPEASQPPSQDPSYYRPAPPASGTKRDFGSTFDTKPLEQPLRHGARPAVSGLDPKYNYRLEPNQHAATADDDMALDLSAMEYRRADGTQRRRRVPVQ